MNGIAKNRTQTCSQKKKDRQKEEKKEKIHTEVKRNMKKCTYMKR